MYFKAGGFKLKRIMSVILTTVMIVPMLAGVTPDSISKVEAATLANPRVSGGVTTWDMVYFGRYQQSDSTGVNKEAIKWRVLQVNGNDAFLMADCNLDTQKFNYNADEYEWSQSTVRSWLNGYSGEYNYKKKDYRYSNFINTAFNASEQEAIITAKVEASANPLYPNTSSNATDDKVFLLSYQEVTNAAYGFLSSGDESSTRTRINTAWVAKGGTTKSNHTKEAGKSGAWWLRTPGRFANNSLIIGEGGELPDRSGHLVNSEMIAICPAIHLDISKTDVWSFAGTVGSDGKVTAGDNPPSVNPEEKVVPTTEEDTKYVITENENGEKTVEYRSENTSEENPVIPDTVETVGNTYKVTSIAKGAFKNNKKIKTVTIGSNIETIGAEAFSGCSNLQTVIFKGNNIKVIGAKAFYKCTKIKKIVIPSSVNKIGKQAFFGCKNLKSITVKTSKLNKKNVGAKAFKGTHKKATFKVPKKKLAAYKKLLKSKGASSKAKFKK